MLYILNAPILTDYGVYRYEKSDVEEVRKLLLLNTFISAVGHESTANFLSRLLNLKIPASRVPIKMDKNDTAIIFRLLDRLPEGKVLDDVEIQNVRYELGILTKVE